MRPRRPLIATLLEAVAAVTALSLLLLAASSANAAAVTGTVSIDALDVTQQTYDCPCPGGSMAFRVTAPDASQFLYYSYEVRVTDPSGQYVASRIGSAEFAGGTWVWPIPLTPSQHPYGTYTVRATVEFYAEAGDEPDDVKIATTSFDFSGPPKPETPTTPTDRATVLTLTKTKIRPGRFRIVSTLEQAGVPVQGELIRLQSRSAHQWRNELKLGRTSSAGRAAARIRATSTGKGLLRLRYGGSATTKASVSRTFRL